MKIIFAGTSHFAEPALQTLIEYCPSAQHELLAVYTQPDRPKGRGQQLSVTPIKALAQHHSITLYQPETLKTKEAQDAFAALEPDLFIVAAYGLLLPPKILEIPQLGCINIHASLLPRWRGAAPIQRALLANDAMTGITIMQMDAGLDTGDVLYKKEEPILPQDTYDSLHSRLAKLGAHCLIDTLKDLEHKQSTRQPQPQEGVCYAEKVKKSEGAIDWVKPAEQLERQVRAFNSWPVSFTLFQGKRIRIWTAELDTQNPQEEILPGTIVALNKTGISVATTQGCLRLTALQLEGGRCLPVSQLLNGQLSQLKVGMMFESIN